MVTSAVLSLFIEVQMKAKADFGSTVLFSCPQYMLVGDYPWVFQNRDGSYFHVMVIASHRRLMSGVRERVEGVLRITGCVP